MNAGAFGHEIATVTQRVRVYAIRTQQVIELSHAECRWGYRSSLFQNEEYVVLGAYFRLHNADRKYLRASRLSNLALRRARYPRSQPNAGSVFKRPPHGLKVGEMIETLGHKGYSIGTAEISDKHAGFIVAKRPAQASDICALIAFMQREMRQHFDVETEEEQKLL
ncbi:hypothetical protein ACUN0G_11700 [Pseudomonas sp. 32A]|uniref:hypothetical protein n=1 Tax=Pseudomonas sp. 32A TaxID=651185 RepID=UPI004045F672